MSTIYTLTLNPVIDVHFALNGLEIGAENYTKSRVKFAAGKGVNISRVLKRHGVNAPAFVLLGSSDAELYLKMLEADDIDAVAHVVPGNIREYVSLNDAASGNETRVCYRDFSSDDKAVTELGNLLAARLKPGDIVCVSGSLPSGVTPGAVISLSALFRRRGALTAIDCASMDPDSLRAALPWLIKPNLREAASLCGLRPDAPLDPSIAATLIPQLTSISPNVLLSLGPAGAVFASSPSGGTAPGSAPACLPAVPIEHCYSSVGAGDSLLAGFLYALISDGRCPPDGAIPYSSAGPALSAGLEFAAETCSERR
ncbi:MAG: hypothetical protein J5950_00695 [Clostridia bacterium]|nr:hypothetical protein [Clostridia bacterium]